MIYEGPLAAIAVVDGSAERRGTAVRDVIENFQFREVRLIYRNISVYVIRKDLVYN